MKASSNPNLQLVKHDPTIFCTAYKKNRFFLFTKREPEETKKSVRFIQLKNIFLFVNSIQNAFDSADNERDVFNEKPTKEEIVAATEVHMFFLCFFIIITKSNFA